MKKQVKSNQPIPAQPVNKQPLTGNPEMYQTPATPTVFLFEHLMDKQDILQTLHVSDRTLYTWRVTGKLPYIKINGKFYYTKPDVHRMLDRHRSGNQPKKN